MSPCEIGSEKEEAPARGSRRFMPGDPKECRKHARNCLRLAEAATNAEITRTFVDLAHSWTRLALDMER